MAERVQVPLADGAQVRLFFDLGGAPVENRLWFVDRAPPVTLTHLVNLVNGVSAWYLERILPHLAQELQLKEVIAYDWTEIPSPLSANNVIGIAGENDSGSHSANVSVLVRFFAVSFAQRIYNWHHVPGIPYDAVATNLVAPAFMDDLFEGYVNLIDRASSFGPSPGWRWVCASSQLAGEYRTEQAALEVDLVQFPTPYVSPFRQRLKRLRPPYV